MKNKVIIFTIALCAFFSLTGFNNCPKEAEITAGAVYEDNKANTYIIGDSRIYFMRETMENASDFNWIAVCGSGYYHLDNNFSSVLDGEDLSGKTIIIESGLNDLLFGGGAENAYVWYYTFYTTKAQEYIKRGAKVKMLKLLPILADSQHNIERNDTIRFYNDALCNNIPSNIGVIDLSNIELGYIDDLHFDGDTSIRLYKELKKYKAGNKKDKEAEKKADLERRKEKVKDKIEDAKRRKEESLKSQNDRGN